LDQHPGSSSQGDDEVDLSAASGPVVAYIRAKTPKGGEDEVFEEMARVCEDAGGDGRDERVVHAVGQRLGVRYVVPLHRIPEYE